MVTFFLFLQRNSPHPFIDASASQELNLLQSEERQEEVCEVGGSKVSQATLWPVGEEKGKACPQIIQSCPVIHFFGIMLEIQSDVQITQTANLN